MREKIRLNTIRTDTRSFGYRAAMAAAIYLAAIGSLLALKDYRDTYLDSFILSFAGCMMLLTFTMLRIGSLRVRNGSKDEKFQNYGRICVFFILCSLIAVAICPLPRYMRPVMIFGILFTLITDITVGMLISTYFSMVIIFSAGGNANLLMIYLILGYIGCILAEYFREKRMLPGVGISILASNITFTFAYDFYDTRKLHYENLYYCGISSFITILVALLFLIYIRRCVDERLGRVLAKICDEEFYLYASLSDQAKEVAYFAWQGAMRIQADSALARAGGLYCKINLLYNKSFAKILPMEVVEIVNELNNTPPMPSTREGAVVLLAYHYVAALMEMRSRESQGSLSREIVVQQVFNSCMMDGTLERSGLTMKMYMDLKECFVGLEEQYAFLRQERLEGKEGTYDRIGVK